MAVDKNKDQIPNSNTHLIMLQIKCMGHNGKKFCISNLVVGQNPNLFMLLIYVQCTFIRPMCLTFKDKHKMKTN